MNELLLYTNVFIDCDGVILDSNHIKEANIGKVLKNHLPEIELAECLTYFNENPGIPREIKLSKFITSESMLNKILQEYNNLNLNSLKNAKLVDGVIDFLTVMRLNKKRIFMVSGGERDELLSVFTYKSLINYFDIIMGGPKSKIENIKLLEYYGESIFFGDSSYDLDVAIHFEMDFVFVSGYTKYSLKSSELNIQFKTIQNFNDLYSPC